MGSSKGSVPFKSAIPTFLSNDILGIIIKVDLGGGRYKFMEMMHVFTPSTEMTA